MSSGPFGPIFLLSKAENVHGFQVLLSTLMTELADKSHGIDGQ